MRATLGFGGFLEKIIYNVSKSSEVVKRVGFHLDFITDI